MGSIRKSLSSGIAYTAIAKYSNIFFGIFIGAVLARLLTPEEFGIVAVVTVFISFFNLLSQFGLGPAIIQEKSLSTEDLSSIFIFTILFGFTLGTIFFFSAPLIASFYDNPKLINLARLMSLSIFLNSLRIVPEALNRKKLHFKKIGIVSVSVNVFTGIIAIILAYKGFSYYALVIRSILEGFFIFSAFYYLEPVKFILKLNFSAIRKIGRFSAFQFAFNFINYFARNTDNLLIGKYFNTAALGYYDKSYRLMMMPIQNLTFVITPVLHPVLSEYQNKKDVIYNSYVKIVKLLATIGFPLSIFLFFSASEIINIIYGPQWEQSIPVFKILALTVGIQIILSSTGSIFQATNRTDLLFYAGLTGSFLILLGIGYGIFIGKNLESVGYGLLVAYIFNFFQAFYLLIKISLKSSLSKFLKTLIFPIILGLSIGIGLYLISYLKLENIFVSLLTNSVTALLVFFLLLFSSKENKKFFLEYFNKIIRKKKMNSKDSNSV